ncbi:related to ER-Golgi SNARE complex subunit BET1 protein [Ramularia collo-cygni]|uniref:Related to ER-Golgi SNARE complex subunit BET1 protein n=1 Tax=Ramularia collo-cygni TaxID=112498 RepID=A0A2D3V6D0_9PEZI|nr:related to ER-Golgi SNARE complex subunit BET1 protein [Ramularia collo-cygni]CZT19096.1 related to ER-Golgi SNARE complex subunit BET1 protein [Ramularia collo-cygni]
MASRFQRDSRNALFSNYDAAQQTRSRPHSGSPAPRNAPFTASANSSSPYGGGGGSDASPQLNSYAGGGAAGFNAYPSSGGGVGGGLEGDGTFRAATPNRRGQYSDAVLSELESQNDDQAGEMSKKVKMLKELTMAIGDEIRDSTAFTEKMNDQFENTRNRLRGTMNRVALWDGFERIRLSECSV